MKKEYFAALIAGLLILAYVLDAVVNPLRMRLATPYHYLDPQILSKYPFTTTSIFIKAIAIFIMPLLLLSYIKYNALAKGIGLLILASLVQLYALQDVVANTKVIPLEWAISLTVAGILLLIPTILFILAGTLKLAHGKMTYNPYKDLEDTKQSDDDDDD